MLKKKLFNTKNNIRDVTSKNNDTLIDTTFAFFMVQTYLFKLSKIGITIIKLYLHRVKSLQTMETLQKKY